MMPKNRIFFITNVVSVIDNKIVPKFCDCYDIDGIMDDETLAPMAANSPQP